MTTELREEASHSIQRKKYWIGCIQYFLACREKKAYDLYLEMKFLKVSAVCSPSMRSTSLPSL
ncbi:hypothetical protein PAESOLCIP111_02663 [Paenibacillus solanacearum]|uniref:Uncharacterized protein n=1 Tax=Paenibacillus solanacearum TaxID=2048548 RepID=A0A916K148_9BACL|nr:hypothetical protein PAESOLCIP111_02663 [Paenibacillus solanacearum]